MKILERLIPALGVCVALVVSSWALTQTSHGEVLPSSILAVSTGGDEEMAQKNMTCDEIFDPVNPNPCAGKNEGDPCVTCQFDTIDVLGTPDAKHPGGYEYDEDPQTPPSTCGVRWRGTCEWVEVKKFPMPVWDFKCVRKKGEALGIACHNSAVIHAQPEQ